VIQKAPSLLKKALAECLGTYLLIFFGCGAVHASVLTGAQSGLWQVAIVWGIAIMLAVYTIGDISGAHINPAITVAFAVWGRLSRRLVLPYVVAQLTGAFLAAATLFVLFNPYLKAREQEKHVVSATGNTFPAPVPSPTPRDPTRWISTND
jgi:glycerol uptake facilitator protein